MNDKIFCPSCGAANAGTSLFCESCGHRLKGQPESQSGKPRARESQPGATFTPLVLQTPGMNFDIAGLFFVRPVLRGLENGKVFSRAFSIALRVVAILIAVTGISMWVFIWASLGRYGGIPQVIAAVVAQLFSLVVTYAIVHVIWIRATDVSNLSGGDFTVSMVAGILTRMAGEVLAAFILGACAVSFVPVFGFNLPTPSLTGEAPLVAIVSGLVVLAIGGFLSFLVLVMSYSLAERISGFARMAINIDAIRRIVEMNQPGNGSET